MHEVMIAIAAAAGYLALSVYMLKRKPGKGKGAMQLRLPPVTHISHRGGAGEHVENTLNAFNAAVQKGSEMLELDVFYTRDGQVVVSHDASLKRLTGRDVQIRDLDFADLPPYQKHIPNGHFSNPPQDCSVS